MICLDLVHAENGLQLDGFTREMGRHGVVPKNKSMEKKKIVAATARRGRNRLRLTIDGRGQVMSVAWFPEHLGARYE
jgi:hypothetical protein